MAYPLKLPEPWRSRGWGAKIRDKERAEPPHVTVLFKTKAWRIDHNPVQSESNHE